MLYIDTCLPYIFQVTADCGVRSHYIVAIQHRHHFHPQQRRHRVEEGTLTRLMPQVIACQQNLQGGGGEVRGQVQNA